MPLLFKSAASHYLSIPYNAAFALGTTFSIMGWVRPTSYTSGAIIQRVQPNSTANDIFSLQLVANGSTIYPIFKLGNSTLSLGVLIYGMDTCSSTTATLPLNIWSHVCGTWDGATMTVYINGVSRATTAKATIASAGTSNIAIGAAFHTATSIDTYLDASVEDLRMYNRALSVAEVVTIALQNGEDGIRNGVISQFRMIGPRSTTLATNGSIADITPNRFVATAAVGGQVFERKILKTRLVA